MREYVFQPVTEMLDSGNCEPLKATVHGAVLALAALCAAYNTAAWLKRRQHHLAINAILYTTTVAWESCQVAHHLNELKDCLPEQQPETPRLPDAA